MNFDNEQIKQADPIDDSLDVIEDQDSRDSGVVLVEHQLTDLKRKLEQSEQIVQLLTQKLELLRLPEITRNERDTATEPENSFWCESDLIDPDEETLNELDTLSSELHNQLRGAQVGISLRRAAVSRQRFATNFERFLEEGIGSQPSSRTVE